MSYSKYYLYKKQVSYDSGVTWSDVTPLETAPSGNPIATYATLEECQGQSPSYSGQYLTFVATEAGTFTFTPTSSNAISYSLNSGSTWTQGNSVSVSNGQKVMWKGTMTPSTNYPYGIGTFSSTSNFTVEGNPMSLFYGDNFEGLTSLDGKSRAFISLFYGCSGLTSAENLSLVATTLANRCYANMFEGCTSLTTAPQLPATTLAFECYEYMFEGCTSLTTAPVLSATTLANYCYEDMFAGCSSLTTAPSLLATTLANGCYYHMFEGCTSLTTAPSLPATTLIENCYEGMFYNCTSLTTAPELLATTLAYSCYYQMFQGCTNLNYIKCLATDISASYCTYNWVNGVASSGTFIRDCNTQWSTSDSGIPSGWTDNCSSPQPSYSGQYLTFVAQESGTFTFTPSNSNTINYSLDSGSTWTQGNSVNVTNGQKVMWKGTMIPDFYGVGSFSGSTGRFTVEGNIMSLLYGDNFENQTSLASTYNTFWELFASCSGLTSAENLSLPATTLTDNCYAFMFMGCTSLITAPSLPATTLAEICYAHMFYGCTSLTTAPELPATTLESYCYYAMFSGCTSLNYIKCLATDISEYACTSNWVSGVASSGTFVKNSSMSSWTSGASGIPTNWTVQNAT